jgi:hypothetical protein
MKKLLLSLLAVFLIIEEWLWEILSALGHYLATQLGLARFENWLAQSTPYQALFAISLPILALMPLNIMAVMLLANGLILQGIGLEIIVKLLGTLFVARFFTLSKNQLLSFRAIAFVYHRVVGWLQWAHQKVVETHVYKLAKQFKAQIKAQVAAWLAR